MENVFRYIDDNRNNYVDSLKSLLRIPSETRDRESVVNYLKAFDEELTAAGFTSQIMESTGNPMLVGTRGSPEVDPVVLLYGHADVMPAGDESLWESPPYEPVVRNGRVYARGSGDNKAQHFAHVLAARALIACGMPVPNLKFLLDGEEETGSASLPAFVQTHREMLQADILYGADGGRHESNRPTLFLGCRGVLGVELTVRGANADVHSGNRGNVVPNPAWRLVECLASLRDPSGRVLIDGFENDVVPPRQVERELLESLPYDGDGLADSLGVESLRTLNGADYFESLMFHPTLNINGIICGYTGPGPKTIIPQSAAVKMDMRLVPHQEPDRILQLLRAHLDQHGFSDILVETLNAMKPSRTPLDHPYVPLVIDAVRTATGEEPVVYPALGGSIPQYAFVEALDLPCIWSAYANWDANGHAPDENMDLDCFIQAIKISASVFNTLLED
jgi:acetylornithine deacetylase/succinyl-diaminopimelate desuccinylase-like protein